MLLAGGFEYLDDRVSLNIVSKMFRQCCQRYCFLN